MSGEDKSIANWLESGEPDPSVEVGLRAPRKRHSAKPEGVQDLLERLVGANAQGPDECLELYARRFRKGWTCFGNELPNGGGPT